MRYCSVECQHLDRNTHKFFCKSFERFTDDKRPSPQHIRAILFPEHKTKPEWKWVLRNEDRTAVCLSHMYERLPTDGLAERTPVMYMSCTLSIKRVAEHWIYCLTLDQSNPLKSTSVVNESVMKLGPPGHLMLYRGPILVVGGMPEMAPSTPDPQYPMINRLEDVTMNDTSFVIEGMLYGDHNSPCVVDVPRYSRSWTPLPALKVNCMGDRLKFHLDIDPHDTPAYESIAVYERVHVPNKMEVKPPRQFACILAFMLGLPWLCRRVANCFPETQNMPMDTPSLLFKFANRHMGSVHSCLQEHGSGTIGARLEVDIVFRGGRPNPRAEVDGDWSEYFDPLN